MHTTKSSEKGIEVQFETLLEFNIFLFVFIIFQRRDWSAKLFNYSHVWLFTVNSIKDLNAIKPALDIYRIAILYFEIYIDTYLQILICSPHYIVHKIEFCAIFNHEFIIMNDYIYYIYIIVIISCLR